MADNLPKRQIPGDAKWLSAAARLSRREGHGNISDELNFKDVIDKAIRDALEQIKWGMSQLQRGCTNKIIGLRADCWAPEPRETFGGLSQPAKKENDELELLKPNRTYYVRTNKPTAITLWLPDATKSDGEPVEVKDADGAGSARNITIRTLRGQTIDGASTFTITSDYGSAMFRSNGQQWYTVARNAIASITAASTTEVLAGTDTAKYVTPDALAALWEKGADITSAATLVIGEGGYFHVTGTTGITAMDLSGNKAGRPFVLVFDGVLILTHHATNLNLITGANITTAAGDRAIFARMTDGSDAVHMIAYSRADGTALVAAGADPDMVTASAASAAVNRVMVSEGADRTVQDTVVVLDPATGNMSAVGTLASGAHTITQATLGVTALAVVQTGGATVNHVGNHVQTTDATVTTLHTFDLSAAGVHHIHVAASGFRVGGGGGHSFIYEASWLSDGATPALNGSAHISSSQGDYTTAMSLSGTNLLVEVTGLAAHTVNWDLLPISYQAVTA